MTNYNFLKEIDPNHAQRVYNEDWAASYDEEDDDWDLPYPRPLARVQTEELLAKLRKYEELVKQATQNYERDMPPLPWIAYEDIVVIYNEIAYECFHRGFEITYMNKQERRFISYHTVLHYQD